MRAFASAARAASMSPARSGLAEQLGPRPHHRHDPRRLRHALSEQAVQSRNSCAPRICRCRVARLARAPARSALRMSAIALSSRRNGWRRISPSRIFASPMRPGTCRKRDADAARRIRSGAHSRRRLLRHRRALGSEERPSAHAARCRSRSRARCESSASATAISSSSMTARAFIPRARALWMMRAMGHDKSRRARRRLPEMAARRTRRGKLTRSRRHRAASLHGAARSGTSSAISTRCGATFTSRPNRWWTREARRASAARKRSRAPGSGPDICRAAINVYYADVLTPEGTMRPPGELRHLFARGRCRSRSPDRHALRLWRHRRDPVAGARARRRKDDRAL